MIDTDSYIQMLFGCHAIRVPIQLAVQDMGDSLVAAVLVSNTKDLTFGSEKPHQLIIGDAIVRPHVVLETNAFVGHGLAGLACESIEEWYRQGAVLINPAGRTVP